MWLVLKYFLVLKMETISEVAKRELGNYKFLKKKVFSIVMEITVLFYFEIIFFVFMSTYKW